MNNSFKIIYILFMLLFLFVSSAFGITTFGPKKYLRTGGAPDVYTDSFDAIAFSGKMIVKNGILSGNKKPANAVSSARIFLNQKQIFGANDFNKNVCCLESQVDLKEHNLLRVELQSAPNSFLTIEIVQEIPSPTISSFSANPVSIVSGESTTLTWNTSDALSCIIEPDIGSVNPDGSVVVTPLETTTFTLTATGPGGSANASIEVTVMNPAPAASLTASNETIPKGESCFLSWNTSNAQHVCIDNGIGEVALNGSVTVTPENTTIYMLTATGPSGSVSAQVCVNVSGNPENLPENSFGEKYQELIPDNSTIDQYDENRFSVITGSVIDISDSPLSGVSVSVQDHPEYGIARTDSEGKFSMPVEGGGVLTLIFQKQDFISAQRKIDVPWNDIAVLDPLKMINENSVSTSLSFDGNPDTIITHKSSLVTDEFGSRSCTMVFSGDNHAYATDENGNDIFELSAIKVRATEFTTEDSMPAKLPPNSGYTYCVELSVDGVKNVRFEKPVTAWVDNFLGFNVGDAVPVGYYDRTRGFWIPSDNGIVVRLLDTNNDSIVDALDATGDNLPDDLNNNGSFSDEVSGLSDPSKYQSNTSVWRFSVSHFTPWDCNWPYGPPPDAISPNPESIPEADQKLDEEMECKNELNSFVQDRSRIFHEDIAIPGTDMTLHYASNRVEGNKTVITIPVSGDEVPASLKNIIVKVSIAGKIYEEVLNPLPNQKIEIPWDGRDFKGNKFNGSIIAYVNIGFVYDAVYYSAGNFAQAFGQAGINITSINARQEIIIWKSYALKIGNPTADDVGKGWTISSHHHINHADLETLFKGDGEGIKLSKGIINKVAGGGTIYGEGQAFDIAFEFPWSMDIDPAGNIYIGDEGGLRVLKMDRKGYITTIAGNGTRGFSGDGGPATAAQLNWFTDIAVDSKGNLYIADTINRRIRKVDLNGIITTVAGNGTYGYAGDEGYATEAQLYMPWSVEVDEIGNIYIADGYKPNIRKVDANGIITSILNCWDENYDGPPVKNISSLLADLKGNLFLSDSFADTVYQFNQKTGEVIIVAGTYNKTGYDGDGGNATDALLSSPEDLSIDESGNIYIVDTGNDCIRKVYTDGTIVTLAGIGTAGYSGDGWPAIRSKLDDPRDIIINHERDIIITDADNLVLRKIEAPIQIKDDKIIFPEESGIGHIISSLGLHEKTIDLATGATLRTFGYNENNQLISITDQFGNQTIIQRNASGIPTAIISPEGITTTLTIDASNHLTCIDYPDGSSYHFEYTSSGLMTAEIEPNGNRFEHQYDANGKLTDVTDEEGGHWHYNRLANETGDILTQIITGKGNITSYLDHTCSTGKFTSTITGADGSVTGYESSADGLSANKSLSCGMELDFEYDVDPAYKTKYIKEMSEKTPSSLSRITKWSRAYVDSNNDKDYESVTETVKVNGKSSIFKNDIVQSKKIITSPVGREVIVNYNPNNLLTESISVPGLFDTNYAYDSKGRMTDISTNSRHTLLSYNVNGFLESMTDSLNQTTTYEYDPVGRVTAVHRPDSSDIFFEYNKNGNMTMLTNPSDIDHGFGYSRVNLQNSYQTPLSGNYSYIYDKDRRLTRTNFPSGKQINNVYANGRLEQIQTPEGNIDLSYLCGTKIGAINKGTESINYGYDGKLVTSETLTGTLAQTLAYTYNNDFNVTGFTYAGDAVTYSYDNDGLLTEAGNFNINRNAQNGLPESVTGGQLSLSRTFNGYGEIESQNSVVGGQGLSTWNLTRDNNGRITHKTETVGGETAAYDYEYDEVGRLLAVTKDGVLVEEYGYDTIPYASCTYQMNTLRWITGRTLEYDDEDKLLSADGTTYQYDLDGFLISKTNGAEITNYHYSSRGELLSLTLPDGEMIEYTHDPLGRRIAKKVNGIIVEKYLWQGLTRLLAVYDGSNNLLMRFEYADDRMPVAITQSGATYYVAYDQVGSLRLVADAAGNVVKRIDYDSFGNIINDTNPGFKIPFSFAGGLQDKDTGLVRFGYRDYDPDTGRWTAKDPIFFAGGDTDLYGYVLNNPVNWIDPFGLQLSDAQIANIIFNETRSFSGPNIEEARRNIAHAIINGDNVLGNNRPITAPTTAKVPPAEESIYSACANAVESARFEREWNDPVNGAMNFNFRNSNSTDPFFNMPIQTQAGPLNNSYTSGGLNASGVYANTYGGR